MYACLISTFFCLIYAIQYCKSVKGWVYLHHKHQMSRHLSPICNWTQMQSTSGCWKMTRAYLRPNLITSTKLGTYLNHTTTLLKAHGLHNNQNAFKQNELCSNET